MDKQPDQPNLTPVYYLKARPPQECDWCHTGEGTMAWPSMGGTYMVCTDCYDREMKKYVRPLTHHTLNRNLKVPEDLIKPLVHHSLNRNLQIPEGLK